jgi:molecular chaperone GrpE
MGRRKVKVNEPTDHVEVPATDAEPGVEDGESTATTEVKVVDKRRFARLLGFGGTDDSADDPPADRDASRLPSYVEELKRRVEASESSSRAEVEAARARLERHFESRLVTAKAEMAAGMLDVLDNLDRALSVQGADESPLHEGLVATRDLFMRKLIEMGVEPVSGVGEPFDPESHQAIDEVEVEDPELDGRVAEVLQRGFRTADRLVRPAFVRVGRWHGGSDLRP